MEEYLGFIDSAWRDLKEEEQVKVKAISKWDLTCLTGDQLIRQGFQARHLHDSAVQELKKFLCIKVLRDITPMGCFGPPVAAAWHAFIMDTQRYEEFCHRIYGKTIHHKPSNYGSGVMDNTAWISVYHNWFGPFPQIWKMNLGGEEIIGYEQAMNVVGNVTSSDMDSDDGAFAMAPL
jgi:hypothetical protein